MVRVVTGVPHPLTAGSKRSRRALQDLLYPLISAGFAIWIAGKATEMGSDNSGNGVLESAFAATCGAALWSTTLMMNRRLGFFRRWLSRPLGGNLLPASLNALWIACATALLYALRQWHSGQESPPGILMDVGLLGTLAAALMGFIYRLRFVIAVRRRSDRRVARLRRSEFSAQMAALKAQLDPHFLLNSIATLCHLIDNQPAAAESLADDLAWTYRYVIDMGRSDLVELSEELQFVERYFSLIRSRFSGMLALEVARNGGSERRYIPPLALQTLVENAIKHNELCKEAPLVITIEIQSGQITVSNTLRPRPRDERAEGVGLINLDSRLRLLTGRGLKIERDSTTFRATIPLIEALE